MFNPICFAQSTEVSLKKKSYFQVRTRGVWCACVCVHMCVCVFISLVFDDILLSDPSFLDFGYSGVRGNLI